MADNSSILLECSSSNCLKSLISGFPDLLVPKTDSGQSPFRISCDVCLLSDATIFCQADAAYLCIACDAEVHEANRLASRHERAWICNLCEQFASVIVCKTDASILCAACDRVIYSAKNYSLDKAETKSTQTSSLRAISYNLTPPDVDRTSCSLSVRKSGAQKQDVTDNLSNFAYSLERRRKEPVCPWQNYPSNKKQKQSVDLFLDFDAYGNVQTINFFADSDPSVSVDYPTARDAPDTQSISSSSIEMGKVRKDRVVVETSNSSDLAASIRALPRTEREARVMRYKEKRKNRKFVKTIRYASRKAYAEVRPRVRGRFVKVRDFEQVMLAGVKQLQSGAVCC